MDGIINLWKPTGMTSHDAVYKVRRALHIKRVGHTGTLDPLAEGVLPICVGKATKMADYISASQKTYIAVMALGRATNTQDITGDVTAQSEKHPSKEQILKAVSAFTGEIYQIPPMFSAVHHKGKRLYELARQGVTVEREPRKITIYNITVLDIEGKTVKILVECAKGTYIRTLCHDIGLALGTYACMTELVRTRSGVFLKDTSISLETLETEGEKHLIPPDEFFMDYEKIVLPEEDEKRVRNGVMIKADVEEDKHYRLYGGKGEFLCVSKGCTQNSEKYLKMELSFY
jgi:tRNA pseudouridine55 synthase